MLQKIKPIGKIVLVVVLTIAALNLAKPVLPVPVKKFLGMA